MPHPAVHAQGPTLSAASVLVVEDNDTTPASDREPAAGVGLPRDGATDGPDALQKVRDRPFDAILMDLVLPHVDGWQFRATQLGTLRWRPFRP